MKSKLYILILTLVSLNSFAQQNAQFSQYIFNQMIINPAYAGNKESWNLNGIYSSQWVGLNGAPTTQTISIDGEISDKIGIGFHIVNDKIGALSQQGLFGNYAYKLKLNDKLKLALGVAVGASYFTLDGSKFTMENQDDPAISSNIETQLKLDSKSGLFLYSNKFYAGLSVSDLFSDVFKSKNILIPNQAKHYYLTSGYVFSFKRYFKFKPSFLIKEDFKAPTNIDLNAFILYYDRFWIGLSYRTGAKIFTNKSLDHSLQYKDALVFMADINISDRFRVGYAYTHSLSAFSKFPGHEICLGYNFLQKPEKRMKYLKYF
jgi:type IX secretion system PorP/SprF family membrane protein